MSQGVANELIDQDQPSAKTEDILAHYVVFPDRLDLVPAGAARLTGFRVLLGFSSGIIAQGIVAARTPPSMDDLAPLEPILLRGIRESQTLGYMSQCARDDLGLEIDLFDAPFQAIGEWDIEHTLDAAMVTWPVSSVGELRQRRHEAEAAAHIRLSSVIAEFVRWLDTDILALLDDDKAIIPSHYNYLAAGEPVLRRNRVQARTSFPLVFRNFVDHKPSAIRHGFLSRAVDEGRPLAKMLVDRLRVSPSVARAILHCPPDSLLGVWDRDLEFLGRIVDALEPAWRPTTSDQWNDLHEWTSALRHVLELPTDSEAFRAWLNDGARAGFPRNVGGTDLIRALRLIEDFVTTTARVVRRHNHIVYQERNDIAGQVLARLGRRRLFNVVTLAQGWHEAYAGVTEANPSNTGGKTEDWPVPLERFETADRIVLAITNERDLWQEGEAMNHCVATYSERCATGRIQIWSIRDHDLKRCSTLATLILDSAGRVVELQQNQANGNSRPDELSHMAALALREELVTRYKELEDYHAWRNRQAKIPLKRDGSDAAVLRGEAALQAVAPEFLAEMRRSFAVAEP